MRTKTVKSKRIGTTIRFDEDVYNYLQEISCNTGMSIADIINSKFKEDIEQGTEVNANV